MLRPWKRASILAMTLSESVELIAMSLVRLMLQCRRSGLCIVVLSVIVAFAAVGVQAQTDPAAQNQQGQASGSGGTKQAPPPEAGGPNSDTGPYAIPKLNPDKDKKPAPPPRPKPTEGMPGYSINVNVPLVTIDALVLTKDGQFIPGLRKEQFRVFEDGVEQKVQDFNVTRAGYTAVMLIEFASSRAFGPSRRPFLYDALRASYAFTDQMEKNDFISVISFDMKPEILVDFTNDKRQVTAALDRLRIPGFSETNLYDALYDTLDRLDRVAGRKEIILIASGIDTFSRITYDKVLKKIKDTPNVTIYAISTGAFLRALTEGRGGMYAQMRDMDYLQADNQMNTFAKMTGGRWFSPRFEGEVPDDFRLIGESVRNQYSLSYKPTNSTLDGKYRKLKVEVVQPGTNKPLIVKDQKGKDVKYQVLARDGYTARHEVE